MGVTTVLSDHIYAKESVYSGTGKERADDLMKFYENDSIDMIFDISGGDLANEVLYRFRYSFIQGNELRGTVIGGNIRCFLKLAGTPYFPNTEGKILLLEAMSGVSKIISRIGCLFSVDSYPC